MRKIIQYPFFFTIQYLHVYVPISIHCRLSDVNSLSSPVAMDIVSLPYINTYSGSIKLKDYHNIAFHFTSPYCSLYKNIKNISGIKTVIYYEYTFKNI